MIVNFSLRVLAVAVLFLVLFFPAQMAFSQRPPSNAEVLSQIQDAIKAAGSDSFAISIGNFDTRLLAFGVFADCGVNASNMPVFSKVPKSECVFSVDQIKVDRKAAIPFGTEAKTFIKTICIDSA